MYIGKLLSSSEAVFMNLYGTYWTYGSMGFERSVRKAYIVHDQIQV